MNRLALLLCVGLPGVAFAADPTTAPSVPPSTTIHVDPGQLGVKVDAKHYGVFLEEINTAIDGGLYAEMVRNRGFEESAPPEGFHQDSHGRWVNDGGYATTFTFQADKDLPYWSVVADRGAQATLSLDLKGNLNAATPRAAKLEIANVGQGRAGIANEGYWGIAAKQGEGYALSVWLKSDAAYAGSITATLESTDGKPLTDPVKLHGPVDGQWRHVTATLQATGTDPKARLVLSADAPGTLWFDMVSLFPAKTFKDRPNGMRADVAQLIADLKPGFVRFPGGCVVEGATHQTAYDWKNTVGPIEQRPEAWNVWDYRRTHGMGFFEYLQFIEDIGASPLFVSTAGQTCIYRRNTEPVPMDQMQPLAQNFLDAMEYANGDASTEWGKRRTEAGHPKPFGMSMMEIGNENIREEYQERYAFIYPQIKAKYPDTLLLACIPSTKTKTEMVDEHYYNSTNWFINNETMYDGRKRTDPPVYIAEVAVTTDEAGHDRGNLQAALAEGVFLMGTERNADVVHMVSYAPLLANVDGRTPLAGAPPAWHGMIYCDAARSFGTASYYLWKTFAQNRPDQIVNTTIDSKTDGAPLAGKIGVGTWGTTAEFKDIKVEKGGQTLFASDFSKPADGWRNNGGQWQVADGVLRQSRRANATTTFGDADWSDYTLTLKARKLSGDEGFLVMFASGNGDRLWWNLGGWGNHEHGIEFNQNAVGAHAQGSIETNRWYDVKVELHGREVKCYLDGVLINQGTVPAKRMLHTDAGIDAKTDELVLKVINVAHEPQTATLDVAGEGYHSAAASVETLTSASPTDNNSLDAPLKVVPTQSTGPTLAASPTWTFPANSLTVIRLKR